MNRMSKDLQDMRAFLQRACRAGKLEPKGQETLMKAWKSLEHGLAVGDVRLVRKAVSSISRVFLRGFLE